MINYIEKGYGLHDAVRDAGYKLKVNTNSEAYNEAGNQSATIDAAVQAIIDSFDPLPQAQAEAITELAEHASELIDKQINPLKAKRIQSDAIAASAKASRGQSLNPQDTAKLDALTANMVYPDGVFAQYDIDEALIVAATDWTTIAGLLEAAKANLDGVS